MAITESYVLKLMICFKMESFVLRSIVDLCPCHTDSGFIAGGCQVSSDLQLKDVAFSLRLKILKFL